MFGMMEALLSFFRRQVGLRTDAASATGSVHAKLGDVRNHTGYILQTIASGTLRVSADAETPEIKSQTMAKYKSVRVMTSGTIRVSFELKGSSTGQVEGQIYKNEVPYGQLRANTSAQNNAGDWVVYSEDVRVVAGEYVQLYVRDREEHNQGVWARNFRIYFDYQETQGVLPEITMS